MGAGDEWGALSKILQPLGKRHCGVGHNPPSLPELALLWLWGSPSSPSLICPCLQSPQTTPGAGWGDERMFPWKHVLPTLTSPKMETSETPVSNYRIQLDPGTHAGTDAVHWCRSKHLQLML